MKTLLFLLLCAAGTLSLQSNTSETYTAPQQDGWDYIGEQNGVKFYWKVTSPSEGKLKAENTTDQKLYVEFDYVLLDSQGNQVKKGFGGFGNVKAHGYSTHPMTDWGNKKLKTAVRIEIDDIKVKVPY